MLSSPKPTAGDRDPSRAAFFVQSHSVELQEQIKQLHLQFGHHETSIQRILSNLRNLVTQDNLVLLASVFAQSRQATKAVNEASSGFAEPLSAFMNLLISLNRIHQLTQPRFRALIDCFQQLPKLDTTLQELVSDILNSPDYSGTRAAAQVAFF